MCTNDGEGEGGEEEGEKQAVYGSVDPYRFLGHFSDPSLAPQQHWCFLSEVIQVSLTEWIHNSAF